MANSNHFRLWERGAWHRLAVLRWLYWWLIRRGIWYVRWVGQEEQLWREAMRHAPLSYRWFGRSLTVVEIDEDRAIDGLPRDWPAWRTVKEQLQPGDKIWPFVVNPWTMAMRAGYVVVRRGKPITGVVTVVS